jgi:hypothetical protein
MPDEPNPPGSVIGALFRDTSIQGDRIRETQLFPIDEDPAAAVLHLRKGLIGSDVPWIGRDGKPVPPPRGPEILSFGIHRDVHQASVPTSTASAKSKPSH